MESCNHQCIKPQLELLLVVLQNYVRLIVCTTYDEQAGVQRRPLTITPIAVFQITPTLVCAMAQLQRKDSDDDLLAGWSSELEALLYSPEVEEAIKEVGPC